MSGLPKKIQEIVNAPIEASLIKTREVKGASLQYISGVTVADILNRAFNFMWDWVADKEWIQESAPYFNQYSKNKVDTYNGKQGEWEQQAPIAHVRGILTVWFENEAGETVCIKKTGYGSKAIIGKQSEQDSIFKAADTDALKKAASRLGIGAELYRSEEEQEYFNLQNDPTAWTNETISKYEEEIAYINNAISTLKEDEITALFREYNPKFSGFDDINPTNISDFYDHIRTLSTAT